MINLRPSTEYLLDYDLWTTALVLHKQNKRGTLTVRINIDFKKNRKAIIETFRPKPNDQFINLDSKRSFRAARFAVMGKVRTFHSK